uniref:Uncharacterized protein n=1 Tax=Arundo donax TaxID=35708 RepID=A0A0A8YWE8_ARUDO
MLRRIVAIPSQAYPSRILCPSVAHGSAMGRGGGAGGTRKGSDRSLHAQQRLIGTVAPAGLP